jgi:hypothetical protein
VPAKAPAKSSHILHEKERGLVTDAQRTELDDAAFEYRVRAKGMRAKKDIILRVWRSAQEKGLRVMARLVGDTPQHLAFVAGLGMHKKNSKPLITNRYVLDLMNSDQLQCGRRDQGLFRHQEKIKISGHGQRRSAVN